MIVFVLANWTWLILVGALLQVVGLLVAVRGMRDLKRDAHPDLPSPLAALSARTLRSRRVVKVRQFVWHTILRRPRRTTHVTAHGTINAHGSASMGRAYSTPPRPPGDASVADILDYFDHRLSSESKQRTDQVDALNKRADDLRDRIGTHEQTIDERLREQADRIAIALGGRDGRGLDEAWLGLVIAAIGLVAQGVAVALGS